MLSYNWKILKWYPYRTIGGGWGGHVLMDWPWQQNVGRQWISELQQELYQRTGHQDNHAGFLIEAPGGRFILYFHDGGLYQLAASWMDGKDAGEDIPQDKQ